MLVSAAGAAASMLFVIANVSPLFAGEAASPPQPAVGKSLSQGMAYQALREKLLAAGWLPLRDPQCWDNIGGEAAVCNQLPETESCSVDGRCIMHFASRQDRAKVRVGTEGPYENLGAPGHRDALKVKYWEFSGLDSQTSPPAACPSHDFDAFLKVFATDAEIKRSFTAPLVRVSELYSTDKGDFTRPVYSTAADFRAFNVLYRDAAFHFVDAEGKTDPAPLTLRDFERRPVGPDRALPVWNLRGQCLPV